MRELVLDAEPIVAYLFDEAGGERVESLLTEVYDGDRVALLSEVTLTEVAYKTAWLLADGRPGEEAVETGRQHARDVVDGGVQAVPPTETWELAARIKADGGIALGDAFAAALAADRDALLVVGADEEFSDLPVPVDLERVRSTPS